MLTELLLFSGAIGLGGALVALLPFASIHIFHWKPPVFLSLIFFFTGCIATFLAAIMAIVFLTTDCPIVHQEGGQAQPCIVE